MIKGVMFDMGGTLVDDNEYNLEKAFDNVYEHFKYKNFSKEEYQKLVKDLMSETLFKRTNFDIKLIDCVNYLLSYYDDELDCSIEELEEAFSNGFSTDCKIENVEEYLIDLKNRGLKLIVLSNTFLSSREITRRLKNHGLDKYFDDIIASSDYLVRKPSKLFFNLGLKKLGLNNNEVVYVGNSYIFDCLGCNDANINFIFYNVKHYNEYDFSNLKIKVKEIKDYKEVVGKDLCQIF